MKRFLYFSFRFVYFINRWVTRRFTKGGVLVLVGLLASAVVGIDTNQTVAYQAFTFLLSLIIVSMIWSLVSRSRFEIKRILPRFGTVGEQLVYKIVVQNKSQKKLIGLYLFEDFEDSRPTFDEFLKTSEPGEETRNLFDRVVGYHRWKWLISKKQGAIGKEQPLPLLLPDGKEDVSVEIMPSRRGRLRLTGLTITFPDPLGLFKSFSTVFNPEPLLVLPKRYPLPYVNLPGTRKYQSGGVALASSVGDSEEFVSLRDYRPGDPLRKIHWRSWAKTGKPVVKEYQDEFFVRHALVLDTFENTSHSEIFEEAVSVAASFTCTIQTQESLLDIMFVGAEAYCFTSGRGLAHTDNMLEILASVSLCTDKPFSVLPPLVFERASILSGCICILLSWDEERKQFVGRLKEIGVPLLVLVITDAKIDSTDGSGFELGPMKDIQENFKILQVGSIQEGLADL